MIKHHLPRSLKELISQGEEDGFLVQDDILLVLPNPEKHIKEVDGFFDDALKMVDEYKRKLEQGSQQTQGEVMEDELKKINEVSKLTPEYPGWMVDFMQQDRIVN